jgi:hypothetical protein
MKTLVATAKNLSKYLFDDNAVIAFEVREFEVNGTVKQIPYTKTPEFNIADLNSDNAVVYENVSPPADWDGDKYFFDGQTWSLNPDYVTDEETA